MANAQQGEVLEGGGIQFSRDHVAELKQIRLTPRIRRPNVVGIAVRWGSLAPLSGVQVLLGLFALLGSLVLLVGSLRDLLAHTGKVDGWMMVGHLAFAWAGAKMIVEAQKSGYYLEVRMKRKVEHLGFDPMFSRAEIDAFLASVESQLGWNIDKAIEVAGSDRQPGAEQSRSIRTE